jgi:2-keto-4-pentenoate hydratase/2-oxohepta-3-ene-1,7-dioic acid hydratase in catechol pathway
MKLAMYQHGDRIAMGVVKGDQVFDLSKVDPSLPSTVHALLEAGPSAIDAARAAADRASHGIPLSQVRLLAPIPKPSKLLGIGFNYQSHVDEVRAKGFPVTNLDVQVWFNKQVSCVIGPFDAMHLPRASTQFDYEAEMAIVIGRRCRHVQPEDARKVIAGYMICNDASIRDWQQRAPTATLGKSFDTHGPTGPWLTTADEIADPENLTVRTWVNGKQKQNGNTSELVHKINAMIAHLSTVCTLEPGDILSTGSPAGVGAAENPPFWLKAGDVVRMEIEGLGMIENPVIDEPADTAFIAFIA